MSGMSVPKADDLERVGHFARVNGKLCIVEYSDLPEALARARNPDGSRRFDDGNTAIHAFSRSFLERLTRPETRNSKLDTIALPWHRAEKKVPFVEIPSGQRIEPDRPNAIKLELFVFDALPLANPAIVLRQDRAECFSPVKNADGVDSPATARRDMVRRAARWLENCGVTVPRRPDGEPDAVIEISPTLALDAAELKDRLQAPTVIARGSKTYLA
jgi:UDP-N-acetylglucosamine/UDP-N-acetylgalactosamine diphosphorylase